MIRRPGQIILTSQEKKEKNLMEILLASCFFFNPPMYHVRLGFFL